MYKYLLCWRYLRTKYIALASIVSVTLGVATLIVVNSVMSGFTTEMKDRLHGILSDVVLESRDFGGFPDPDMRMEQIRKIAGDKIEMMTPVVTAPSMLYFKNGNSWVSRPVQVVGIDPKTYPLVSTFSKYLQHPENRNKASFTLREDGYDVRDHQLGPNETFVPRVALGESGGRRRRIKARCDKFTQRIDGGGQHAGMSSSVASTKMAPPPTQSLPSSSNEIASSNNVTPGNPFGQAVVVDSTDPPILAIGSSGITADPFGQGANPFAQTAEEKQQKIFDPEFEQRTGIVLGMALVSSRDHEGKDWFAAVPGDDVNLTIPTTGTPPKGISDSFTVVDLYESKMSEYDSQLVFVPIKHLQKLRGMIEPISGIGRVNQIQIKLKPGVDSVAFRDALRAKFDPRFFSVMTWMDLQGALLQAVEVERAILNVLLFLIIAVAGFGILAIFLMIVIEKTRDIGILKSLGASKLGIMGIFLNYGLLLGLIGSGVGVGVGLLLVKHINDIADFLSRLRGGPIFDPSVYYFYRIPTIVDPMMIVQVVIGTLLIAVLASILPALRAALMHPVDALRHE